jgi:FtsP/CotA-like multicopper oxidase with cupredoxin domain
MDSGFRRNDAGGLVQQHRQGVADQIVNNHGRKERTMQRPRFPINTGVLLMAIVLAWGAGQCLAQTPDYTKPNYANSPPLHKFVDSLPGLGAGRANNLGQYIPIAAPDTTAFPGSDYYEIGLKDYERQMHTDLPGTTLRGYYQKNGPDTSSQYLGPLILATRDRPVRVKFTNGLGIGSAGDLFLPVDTTILGAGQGPDGTSYTQNRATVHLHGANSPWISDGTMHQWITPAGETSTLKVGADVLHVPDMPPPPAGSMTFYWPNQQSGRLMFYHDHAYGLTRLNVYAGEVAPYLLVDPAEENALKAAGVPGTIPGTGDPDLAHLIPLVIQDKTFVADATTPTQTNPALFTTATDPLWSWGNGGRLWFPHVYQPNQMPEDGAFNPMGRWDYGPWMGPPAMVHNSALPHPSAVPEAFMDTPVINGTAYPFVSVAPKAYRFRILNGCNDRILNLQLYVADASGTDVAMVPADGASYPTANRQPGEPATLPVSFDGRVGGVPDPRTAGPVIYQIGNEAGMLPAMAVLPNTPIDFDWDRKSSTYGAVRNFPLPPDYPRVGYTLILGPAERADVIIDFSQFAGKKLILYNDAPAAFPFFDPRYDIFTNGPDLTEIGGPASTKPGLGPNTRTLMQIRVRPGAPVPFDPAPLQAALPTIFAASQPAPLVAPGVYGGNDLYQLRVPGFPFVRKTFAGFPVFQKSLNEEWDADYGRMNVRLGTNRLTISTQGIDSFGYDLVEPPTESMLDGAVQPNGTQIWFVSHGGVDTHPIHFHLLNVQVINRVDAAGVIKPPDPNEMGWKETVRMSPFENVVLAVRPIRPLVPFQVPTNIRPLDVTKPPTGLVGSTYNKNTNPNPLTIFDWMYVWHCHILGHEEHDMMRPLILRTIPFRPANPVAAALTGPSRVELTWRDKSANETQFKVQRATNGGFTQNLVSFDIGPNNGTFANPGGIRKTVTFTDTTVTAGVTYHYRVSSSNTAGASRWARAAPVQAN